MAESSNTRPAREEWPQPVQAMLERLLDLEERVDKLEQQVHDLKALSEPVLRELIDRVKGLTTRLEHKVGA